MASEWRTEINLPPVSKAQADEWIKFLMDMNARGIVPVIPFEIKPEDLDET